MSALHTNPNQHSHTNTHTCIHTHSQTDTQLHWEKAKTKSAKILEIASCLNESEAICCSPWEVYRIYLCVFVVFAMFLCECVLLYINVSQVASGCVLMCNGMNSFPCHAAD